MSRTPPTPFPHVSALGLVQDTARATPQSGTVIDTPKSGTVIDSVSRTHVPWMLAAAHWICSVSVFYASL